MASGREQNLTGIAMNIERPGADPEGMYGEEYFRTSCGPIPYTRDQPHWLAFFSRIADEIILSLRPKRVLDAGCAMGFLVEAFWDRGVEAWGVDISEFAISQARRDIAPYCIQASLTEPLTGKFDLIVSIEVLEHLSEADARASLENLTGATDTILFSSTPTDLDEPTHINVRPTISWLRLFAEFGFAPDLLYDARFVAPHAILFRRAQTPVSDETNMLFARLVRQRMETHARDMRVGQLDQQSIADAARLREIEAEREKLQREAEQARLEQARLDQSKAQQARLEAEISELRATLHTVAGAQEAASALFREEMARQRIDSEALRQQLREAKEENLAARGSVTRLAEEFGALQAGHSGVAESYAALRAAGLAAEQETAELKAKLRSSEIQTRARLEKLEAGMASLSAAYKRLESEGARRQELDTTASELRRQREAVEAQAADLRQIQALQTQLGLVARNLRSDVIRSNNRVTELYESRIWTSLVSAGRLLEKLPGVSRKSTEDRAPELPVVSVTSHTPPVEVEAAPPELHWSLDDPHEGQEVSSGELLVRGWAVGESADLTVSARVGAGPWSPVKYGRNRSDVGRAFAAFPHAGQSGFLSRLDTSSYAVGEYPLQVRITGASGSVVDITRTILIAPRRNKTDGPQEAGSIAKGNALRLNVEQPEPSTVLFLGASLNVSGFAVAQKGIERVKVWLDDEGPRDATYGLMREDVSELYENFPDSEHSGFVCYWPTTDLIAGTYQLRVQALSKDGNTVETQTQFEIDVKTQYEVWAELHTPRSTELKEMEEAGRKLGYQPKISIVTPVYRTPEPFLKKCIDSVLRQVYGNWELILVDDASHDRKLTALLESYASRDSRIRIKTRLENGGIAAATNDAIALCTGEYVALLDHDDEISADALYRVAEELNRDSSIQVFYSDEDKIGLDGKRTDGFFKPEWSPELLTSMNYVCHFLVCSRPLLQTVGGLRLGFDGSQDYDLILRLSEETGKIRRIPKVLYHWRVHPQSTAMSSGQKPKASDAGKRALEEHLKRTGAAGSVEEVGVCRYRTRYRIEGQPEVSIIIPTGGSEKLKAALDSLFRETTYRNYHVIVVDNSSGDQVRRRIEGYQGGDRRIEWLDRRKRPFNFSALCNDGAAQSNSPYLLFLNDDTSVITPDWLETMLEHAQRREVGAVGAQLWFPNDTIQHAGVVVGIVGIGAHVFRGFDANAPHYFALSQSTRNYAAVTGACLFTRRDVFDEVGRFDETNLPTCFQDVDLCLKMIDAGYRVVYTPYARLYHYESATKRAIANANEIQFMEDRWAAYIKEDPFYNPNLSKRSDRYELDLTV